LSGEKKTKEEEDKAGETRRLVLPFVLVNRGGRRRGRGERIYEIMKCFFVSVCLLSSRTVTQQKMDFFLMSWE
jgi:hypothetical protein